MALPDGTRVFTIEVRHYLSCYRACEDADRAIDMLFQQEVSYSNWKVQWAGICSILKAAIMLMPVDARRCFSSELRNALQERFDHLRKNKPDYELYWQFVDRERHNILKEYEFSAYAEIIKDPENDDRDIPGLFADLLANKELRIKGGPHDGQLALQVAKSAALWVRRYIEEAIRIGGFEPDERIQSDHFLGWRRLPKPSSTLVTAWWDPSAADKDAPAEAIPQSDALLPPSGPHEEPLG